jgi:hypothetical protein
LIGYNKFDGRISLFRTTDGTSSTTTRYDGSDSSFSGDICIVSQWSTAGRNLWSNKTPVALVLQSGSPLASTFDSTATVVVANLEGGGFAGADIEDMSIAMVIESTALTTTQRETITDLINAL